MKWDASLFLENTSGNNWEFLLSFFVDNVNESLQPYCREKPGRHQDRVFTDIPKLLSFTLQIVVPVLQQVAQGEGHVTG